MDFREAAARRARAAQEAAARQLPSCGSGDNSSAHPRGRLSPPHGDQRIALAFMAALVIAGIWIADTLAVMRKNQDCVLTGRRGCTPVEAPIRHR